MPQSRRVTLRPESIPLPFLPQPGAGVAPRTKEFPRLLDGFSGWGSGRREGELVAARLASP